MKAQGTVISCHSTSRSYIVEGPSGTIRMNRRHLAHFPDTVTHTSHTPHVQSASAATQPGEPKQSSTERPESPPKQTPKAHAHTSEGVYHK